MIAITANPLGILLANVLSPLLCQSTDEVIKMVSTLFF